MGSGSITSAMQTNVQLMEIQIKLVDALTQLQVRPTCICCMYDVLGLAQLHLTKCHLCKVSS